MYSYSIIITRNGQEIKKFLDFLPVLSIYFSIECQLLLEVKISRYFLPPPFSIELHESKSPACSGGIVMGNKEGWYPHVSSHPSFSYRSGMEASRVSSVPFS